jgi:hypothetical protein
MSNEAEVQRVKMDARRPMVSTMVSAFLTEYEDVGNDGQAAADVVMATMIIMNTLGVTIDQVPGMMLAGAENAKRGAAALLGADPDDL